jgi:cytidyltransferase-like protein
MQSQPISDYTQSVTTHHPNPHPTHSQQQPTRVYIDGIFDLFHIGHIRALTKAKNVRKSVQLIVGIIGDEDATPYKRKPIYDENARYEIIQSLHIVDETIFPAPLIVTRDFVDKHKIDLVVHGFSGVNDYLKQEPFFEEIKFMFEAIPYYPYTSTSGYMKEIYNRLGGSEVEVKEVNTIGEEGVGKIERVERDGVEDSILPSTSSYHGGADVHLIDNLVEDMSVTTNTMGMVDGFFDTMTSDQFAHLATHYPPNGGDPELLKAYKGFVFGESDEAMLHTCPTNDAMNCKDIVKCAPTSNIMFGNGATELIDLLIRQLGKNHSEKNHSERNHSKPTWKSNHVQTQYREYRNACTKSGFTQSATIDCNTDLTVIINPNNPTGDFLDWNMMTKYVEQFVANDSELIVDESMLFWKGADWRNDSFTSHTEYIAELQKTRGIRVYVVQSWTKFFSSTGLRIGSLVVFDNMMYSELSFQQPPWSMNAIGRAYLLHAFNTPEYAKRTWLYTPQWRAYLVSRIKHVYPHWEIHGAGFTSWIWINTKSELEAETFVDCARKAGFPIRHGKQGYNMNTFIRIAVRDPDVIGNMGGLLDRGMQWSTNPPCDVVNDDAVTNDHIQLVIAPPTPPTPPTSPLPPPTQSIDLSPLKQKLIIGEKHVNISQIKIHENFIQSRADSLHDYIKSTNFSNTIPSVIVGAMEDDMYFIIDGHHRFEVMKRMSHESILVTIVDYMHPDIMINPPKILLQNASSANGSSDLFDSSTVDSLNSYEKNKMKLLVANGGLMPPKSTEHVLRISNTFTPIANIANMMGV